MPERVSSRRDREYGIMIVSLKEIMAYAEENKCAVGAFNTPTLESLNAVISAAEELDVPVIISHAELHEPWAPLDVIGPHMVLAAKNARVPVCVHLDHGEHFDYIKRAIELGFTSVMYDGSALEYAENSANTFSITEYAHALNVDVEAEIGALASREDGHHSGGAVYTDPELAQKFVKDTGIDALAASFGTAHGIYKEKPKLDFPRIEKIRELTGLPLVMHGGSGVSPEDYRRSIECGIRKINYYSYMAREGVFAARKLLEENPGLTYFHELAAEAEKAMKADAMKAMRVLSEK